MVAKHPKTGLFVCLIVSLFMALIMSIGMAQASAGYNVTHVPVVVPGADGPQDLGSIIVECDNLPQGTDQFIVKFPDDFEIDSLSANLISPNDGSLRVDFEKSGINQGVVTVYNDKSQSEAKFFLNISALVPIGVPEAINATLIAEPGSVFPNGIVQVALSAESVEVMSMAGDYITLTQNENRGKVRLYFREKYVGGIGLGQDSLILVLPVGFAWAQTPGDYLVEKLSGDDQLIVHFVDERTVSLERTTGGDQTIDAASIWKVECTITVNESEDTGDIFVDISGNTPVNPTRIKIGTYLDDSPILTTDVNGDGVTNITDAVLVLKYITGL